MNSLIDEITQYVIQQSEKYKESDDSYDFWNEHVSMFAHDEAWNWRRSTMRIRKLSRWALCCMILR